MHLRAKEWALLATPLAIATAVWAAGDYFVGYFDLFLPKYQLYRNVDFEQKTRIYMEIFKNKKLFDEISNKVKSRPAKSKWLIDHYLYLPKAPKQIRPPKTKKHSFTLQMVIPGSGYAMIDDRIYKIGEKVDGFIIAKITTDSVELKKGNIVKWLKLFR
ncbi:hypothetical protein [Hydrogenimonas sp.]